MELLAAILTIIISSVVIYFAGEKFANTSSKIGDFFNVPRDVKGATFDAISSSLPELLVALYSVIFFRQFEVGIGTIAGSALFNLLVIPGLCVFMAPVAFKVSKKVISRDALFYLISVFILVILLIYFKTWGLFVSLVLLLVYAIYVGEIIMDTKDHKKNSKLKMVKLNISKEFFVFFILLIIIGVFTFLLTDSAIALSNILGVPAIIIAFTIVAAATSVPDTVISVVNARKGDVDDATSNVFGSNIFNILVGLSLPLLIYSFYKGSVEIIFDNLEIVLGILGSTIMVLYFFGDEREITKKQAGILLLGYILFVVYTVYLALI